MGGVGAVKFLIVWRGKQNDVEKLLFSSFDARGEELD